MFDRTKEARRPTPRMFSLDWQQEKGTPMNTLTKDAINALSELESLEKSYCLKMVDRLKHLGLHQHSSNAICALATAAAVPVKK